MWVVWCGYFTPGVSTPQFKISTAMAVHPAEVRRLCLARWNAAGIQTDELEANRVVKCITGQGNLFAHVVAINCLLTFVFVCSLQVLGVKSTLQSATSSSFILLATSSAWRSGGQSTISQRGCSAIILKRTSLFCFSLLCLAWLRGCFVFVLPCFVLVLFVLAVCVHVLFVHVVFVCSRVVCAHVMCARVFCTHVVCARVVCAQVVCSRVVCSRVVCAHFSLIARVVCA